MSILKIKDLIPGASYHIEYKGPLPHLFYNGNAIFAGIGVFAGYDSDSLCFHCLTDGKPDGSEGVFELKHITGLASTCELAARIVQAFEKDFSDRRGLSHEWDQITENIKSEIRSSWIRLVEKELTK